MEYRYIPCKHLTIVYWELPNFKLDSILKIVYSTKNFSICDNEASINGSISSYGVITSPNYPNWLSNQKCKVVINAPEDKVIRVYISDISIEAEDANSGE
jgi:hypothetical protein